MARRKIAVIDCETDPFKKGRIPKPFIWGFYDGLEYKEFADAASLVDFLRPLNLIVYAHNGGKFDYMFLLEYLTPYDDVMIISGRLAKFKIGLCEFRDSYNIIPVALSKFEKMEFDYCLLEENERSKEENKIKISEYLRSDCVNLYALVSAFVERFGINLTQAGTAMKQWSKMTEKKPPRTDGDFYNEFKPYYYGGRVQCFESGIIESPFSVADINSAYPYAMMSEHPTSAEYYYEEGVKPNNLTGDLFLTIKAKSNGALPFRGLKGELFFPADDDIRTFNVTGWELLAAFETDSVEVVEWVRTYSFIDLVSFRAYIEYFYTERLKAKQDGDKARDLFCKLLMNSLYGKFGANPEEYKKYSVYPAAYAPVLLKGIGGREYAGELGPWALCQRDLDDEEMRYYNVATAASITGYVRAMLWRSLCACERPLYCDTDSIAAASISGLDFGKELGKWKNEGDFIRGGIGGKKMYIFEGVNGETKTASKGVKLTNSELWRLASGEEITYEPENPTFSVHHAPRFISRRVKLTGK